MKRIFIAEDDPASRLMLSEALQAWGYEVTEAVDGEQALEKLSGTAPDLVLMDVQMPRLDGLSAVQQIRSDPDLSQLRVVALTAFAMAGDAEKCLAAGFDDYITKPVNLAELRQKIELIVRGGVSPS